MSVLCKGYRGEFIGVRVLWVMLSICWIGYIEWESRIGWFSEEMNI